MCAEHRAGAEGRGCTRHRPQGGSERDVPAALELELKLEARPVVSNVSISCPSLLSSGSSFWVLVSLSVKWAPEIEQDECEGRLRFGVVCFEKGGLEWQVWG